MEKIVILTGGEYTPNTVSIYSIKGFESNLPSLLRGRRQHGCGQYIDNNNKQVTLHYYKVKGYISHVTNNLRYI